MPGELIRNTLLADVVDTTASSISALNPDIFPLASDVPDYAYKSISTLLGVASADLGNYIVAVYGEGLIPATACIVIQCSRYIESADYPVGYRSNAPGAETTKVSIMVRNVKTTTSQALVKNLLLRIRFLIDRNLRQYRTNNAHPLPPHILLTGDKSVGGYCVCYWEDADVLKASEGVSQYRVEYLRLFPKRVQ